MQRKGFSRDLIQQLLEDYPLDERGQIRELLEKKGFYYDLYMSQFKNVE